MTTHPYSQLVGYKHWADRGLYDVVAATFDRLPPQDGAVLLRILDHMHVVDRVFQHHLLGRPHEFRAPRSEHVPALASLATGTGEIDDWYRTYVDSLSATDFDDTVDFHFTNGSPARMRRGDIVCHVCLHGTYHRGNAGLVLQKNGIEPNDDRMTDYLEATA